MGAHRIWNCTRAVAVAAVLLTAACSDDDGGGDAGAADGDTSTSTEAPEPTGPAATVDGQLTGGAGVFIGEPALLTGDAVDLDEFGFIEEEFAVSGTASSYEPVDGELPADGTYDLSGPTAPTTAPASSCAARPSPTPSTARSWSSGSTSAAASTPRPTSPTSPTSCSAAATPGSASRPSASASRAGRSLVSVRRRRRPGRQGSEGHRPRALRRPVPPRRRLRLRHLHPGGAGAARAGDGDALGGLEPERVLAVGESQSAFALTTYVNGVQPLARAFDGFLVHSRGGAPAPLGSAPG